MADRHSKLLIGFLVFCFFVPALVFAGSYIINPYHFSSGGGCSASYGSEINTDANAAYPTASDTNATTGWSNVGGLFTSETTAPYLGTYHFKIDANSTSDARIIKNLNDYSPSVGTIYKLSAYYRHSGTGGDWKIFIGPGGGSVYLYFRTTITNTDTTYQNFLAYFIFNDEYDRFIFRENNASNDGIIYVDDFSFKTATLCYGSELHTDGNAASPGANEGNATTGWTNVNVDTFESTTAGTPQDGSYTLHLDNNTTPEDGARIYKDIGTDFSLQAGHKYFISFWAKHSGTGGAWGVHAGSNSSFESHKIYDYIPNTQTTWMKIGRSFVYDSTWRYLKIHEASGTNDGEIYIDGLSVKEITDE